jgi:hypothetical protein
MTSPTITTLSTTQGLLAAVRAACCLLNQAPDEVSAVTVAGDLEPGSTALPVLPVPSRSGVSSAAAC